MAGDRPSEYEVQRAEEALREIAECEGPEHDEGCPADDTCSCADYGEWRSKIADIGAAVDAFRRAADAPREAESQPEGHTPVEAGFLQVLQLLPGDVLVLSCKHVLSIASRKAIRDRVRKNAPRLLETNDLVFLEGGLQLSAIRPPPASAPLWMVECTTLPGHRNHPLYMVRSVEECVEMNDGMPPMGVWLLPPDGTFKDEAERICAELNRVRADPRAIADPKRLIPAGAHHPGSAAP